MINNYFTLEAILAEISYDIKNSAIISSFTRVKRTLDLILMKDGRKPSLIKVSCVPNQNYLFLKRELPAIPKGAAIFPAIIGVKIIAAEVVKYDRVVIFRLSNQQQLVVNFFGTHSNVYLTDSKNKVVDRFLKRGLELGEEVNLTPKESTNQHKSLSDVSNFNLNDPVTAEGISQLFPYLSKELASEIIFRLQHVLQTQSSLNEISDFSWASKQKLLNCILREILDELSHPTPCIYYKENKPYLFSIIRLHHLSSLKFERCITVNSCIIRYVSETERNQATEDLKKSLSKTVRKKIRDIKTTIEKIEKELAEHREKRYRFYAETLMANFAAIPRGSSSYAAKWGEDLITIPLDPKLKPIQNAQLYFEKAKKARISQSQAIHRKEELDLTLKKLECVLAQVETVEGQQQLKSILNKEGLKPLPQTKFRKFDQHGYVIYVGRNTLNNEELTFNYARPNDIFLHARGTSGSHVIIRNQSKNYPPKKIIEFAAELAAYYSKANSSLIVPVTYTMKKYVKKVKGKPGSVRIDREEVIFVSPKKPAPHE